MLTHADIAEVAGVSRRTVTEWCSQRMPIGRRLRVVRITRKTVRVRPADWAKFQESNLR